MVADKPIEPDKLVEEVDEQIAKRLRVYANPEKYIKEGDGRQVYKPNLMGRIK